MPIAISEFIVIKIGQFQDVWWYDATIIIIVTCQACLLLGMTNKNYGLLKTTCLHALSFRKGLHHLSTKAKTLLRSYNYLPNIMCMPMISTKIPAVMMSAFEIFIVTVN